jgi:hypothetical protein
VSAGARLDEYLQASRRRLRALIWSRAGAASSVGILLLSVAAILFLQQRGFPAAQVWVWRLVILALLALVAALLLWRPLRRLQHARGAPELERQSPAQQGRLATFIELRERAALGEPSLLTDLLAQDALDIADREPPPALLRRALPYAALGALGFAVLAGLLLLGRAGWGYGARHLLLGVALPKDSVALRSIDVVPGDATLRRNSDLRVTAVARGFDPDTAQLMVRFATAQDWEPVPMKRLEDGRYEFTLFALREPLRYQVRAAGVRSAEHAVNVVDAPRIDALRLTYRYPEWTGLPTQVDDSSRDIRAVAGTRVDLEIESNVPLDSPVLLLSQEPAPASQAALQVAGVRSTGQLAVAKPARYRIAARVANELVPLSDEYQIEVLPDQKPVIEIVKPGRDARASSIEEVPVRIRASDDFRLRDVQLRYAVNGGRWESVNLARATQQTEDTTLLRLEDIDGRTPLQPGDLVSYYAVARDHEQSAQTDLYMVQVQAFDRRYTQGGGGGGAGGGGAGEEQNAISERQREILLATWNLQRERDAAATTPRDAASAQRQNDSAGMLGELQSTLAQQTLTLAARTKARAADNDPRVAEFLTHLEHAATAMAPAAEHLGARRLEAAIPVEQQALQHLQRAEATFRDIQVSRQQGGGAGGGGNQSMADLSELFELEMDLDKSQYETESRIAERQAQQPELDEALRKLKQLAARQEQAAQQAARDNAATKEQRWQQEQLRREAEELRRKLEQLARNERQQQQNGQGQANSQQQGKGQQSNGQGGQQGGQQGAQQGGAAGSALESLRPALDQLRNANATPAAAEQAARRLRDALDRVERKSPGGGAALSAALDKLAGDADRMTQSQRDVQKQLQDALGAQQSLDRERSMALAQTKQRLLEELNALQNELRASLGAGKDTPQTRQRVGEILDELGKSGAATRLGRSAGELQFGRSREVAPREGLITEAMEKLAKDLHGAAGLAAQEGKQGANGATPQQLMAEIAELRAALAQARAQADTNGRGAEQAGGKPGEGAAAGAAQGNSQGNSPGNSPGNSRGNAQGGGGGNDRGLSDWNAINARLPAQQGARQSRDAAQIASQLEQIEGRLRAGTAGRADMETLRRLNRGVRSMEAGELAARSEALGKLVERVELAALTAAQKAAADAPANAAAVSSESPAQREAAAEYYRRLGGS